jgi:hypothetical protein
MKFLGAIEANVIVNIPSRGELWVVRKCTLKCIFAEKIKTSHFGE